MLPMLTEYLDSWSAFIQLAFDVAAMPNVLAPAYIFRGHADADWELTLSLLRYLPRGITPTEALKIEDHATERFRREAHLHVPMSWLPPSLPGPAPAEWWTLMQHHHAPTRLLDWTYSLYVAGYFAVESMWDRDGAVIAVQASFIHAAMNNAFGQASTFEDEQMIDPNAPKRLAAIEPPRRTDRMVAQQGVTGGTVR